MNSFGIRGIILQNKCVIAQEKDIKYKYLLKSVGIEGTKENTKSMFVKAVLLPPNDEWWTDPDTWAIRIDQNNTQDWFDADKERYLAEFRAAVKDWWKQHVLVDQVIDKLTSGYYWLKYCTVRELCRGVRVLCDDSSIDKLYGRIDEMRGISIVGRMYDNSSVGLMRGSSIVRVMHDNSIVSKMHDNSIVNVMHDHSIVSEMHDNSTVNEMHDHSIVSEMHDNSFVRGLHDNSTVITMYDTSIVSWLNDASIVITMYGGSKVHSMCGTSTVGRMRDASTIGRMCDNSKVDFMSDSSIVSEMYDNSNIGEMRGTSTIITMYGTCTVRLMSDTSTVITMQGNSRILSMRDTSTVRRISKSKYKWVGIKACALKTGNNFLLQALTK